MATTAHVSIICCSVTLLFVSCNLVQASPVVQTAPYSDWIHECYSSLINSSAKSAARLMPFPGSGWDNLRNKDMGHVADISFAECKISDDGLYLLPKNVILYARKESHVEMMSEIIENHKNYKSSVSSSINADASVGFFGFHMGGKYSQEYQNVKEVSSKHKLDIARVQLRYRLYSVKLQPDFKLSAPLVSRLTDIVNAIVSNKTRLSRYLSDLVVRDFGTHVTTTLEVGGILEKIDYYNSAVTAQRDYLQDKFSASMSVSFLDILKANFGTSSTVTSEDIRQYKSNVRKTSVKSHGGPIIGSLPNLEEWVKGLRENIVPVDRDGEPLFAVISRRSLPEIPTNYMHKLKQEIERAVTRYYLANEIKGCQDPHSENFNPAANMDAPCIRPVKTFSFGGVYQTCQQTGTLTLCNYAGENVPNPLTGTYSCPSGFETVQLFSIRGRSDRHCVRKTRRCWLFFTCDDGETCQYADSMLHTHWCAPARGVTLPANSGMLYGGTYTSGKSVNEITKTAECSEFFSPYQIGREAQLCLSKDLTKADLLNIQFGGFFSCSSGNPLADPKRDSSSVTPAEAPKHCPDGFSQVTIGTFDGCAVMHCVKARKIRQFLEFERPQIKRPPFEEPDYELIEHPVVQVEQSGWRWAYNVTQHAWSFLGFFGGSGGAGGNDKAEINKSSKV